MLPALCYPLLIAMLMLSSHGDPGVVPVPTTTTVDCSQNYVVSSQSGTSSTCPLSPNLHWWPLGDVTYCHGWAGTDATGKTHLNSAKNIRCGSGGTSFVYDQYAGNLDCSGTAESKTYSKTCTVGVPSTIYDLAVNLECCGAKGFDTAGCTKGVPVVISTSTTNNLSYKNKIQCASAARIGQAVVELLGAVAIFVL